MAPTAPDGGSLPLWIAASREAERLAEEAAKPVPALALPGAAAAPAPAVALAGPAQQLGAQVDVPLFAPNTAEALIGAHGNRLEEPADLRKPVEGSHVVGSKAGGAGGVVVIPNTGTSSSSTSGNSSAASSSSSSMWGPGRRLKGATPRLNVLDPSAPIPTLLMAPPAQDMLIW